MGTLKGIRMGLAANLASIEGVQISPYMLTNPTVPTLEVFPDPESNVQYHKAFANGVSKWVMCVRGIAGAVTDIGGQETLDEWLEMSGPTSVFAAIESETTLDGRVADVTVTECTGYSEYIKRGTQSSYFASTWVVEVLLQST